VNDVSVVIVSYRTPGLTLRAVRSAQESLPGAETVVLDNASGDSSVEQLRTIDDQSVRIEVNATNVGYGAAANRAVRLSRGNTVVFLNSDALLTREAAAHLVGEVRALEGRCLAGARMVDGNGAIQRSAGLLPAPLDLAVRAWGLNRVGAAVAQWPLIGSIVRRSRLSREYSSATEATESMETSMVGMAVSAIGRDAFNELGGFDEQYFLYFEDADLCRRAGQAGIPVRYVPAAVVSHIGGGSSSEDYHFGPHHARSMRVYLGKWYGPGGSALALFILWIRAAGLTLTFQGGARRAWRAWWAAWRDEDPRR
jgi:GT2 family glycosyltransferase